MVDEIVTRQELIDAKRDARDLGKAVNEKVVVSPRYGEDFRSLPMIAAEAQGTIGEWEAAISLITQEGGVPALAVSDASGETQQEINNARVVAVDSIADLLALPAGQRKEGLRYLVQGYHAGSDVGGGEFYWDSSRATENDGGSVIFGFVRVFGGTVSVKDFGALDGTDASDALDKFAAFVLLNPNLLYDVTGDFEISRPWLFDHRGVKAIHWNLRLTTTAPMQCALALEGVRVEHTGKIEIRGQGSASQWDTFTLDYGVVVSGCQGSTLPYISAHRCRFHGVIYNEDGSLGIPLRTGQSFKNNTMVNIDSIQGADCGGYNSGFGEAGSLSNLGFVANFSNPVRTGSAGVNSQRTTIDVDILPPVAASSTPIFAVINDKVFRLFESSGTSGSGSISIFPWMPPSWESGEVKYIFGGTFYNIGPNGGPTKVGRVDSIRCAISVHDSALYGATVLQNVAQFCSIGLMLGIRGDGIGPQSSATIGFYTEGVFRNIVQIGSGSSHITNRHGEFAGKAYINCERIHPQATSGDSLFYHAGFDRVFMPSLNSRLSLAGLYSKEPGNTVYASTSLDANSCIDIVVQRNSWTVNIQDVTNENKNTGLDFATIKAIGTNNRGAPTGSFTFNAPLGWTVNGVESVVLSGFYEVAEFLVSWDFAAKNVIVNCTSRRGSTAAPTTGDWLRGDRVYNTTPAEGGVSGWVCTASGTPGAWRGFGAIES